MTNRLVRIRHLPGGTSVQTWITNNELVICLPDTLPANVRRALVREALRIAESQPKTIEIPAALGVQTGMSEAQAEVSEPS